MNTRPDPDIPCYFGPHHGLFGLYHPDSYGAHTAVLLCPPLGQDMIRCHRLYRQLAHALAGAGSAVAAVAALSLDLRWLEQPVALLLLTGSVLPA